MFLKFRRGVKYDAIILDPPAFGRGPKQSGKKQWSLEKDLDRLLDEVSRILSEKPCFILLSCHDASHSGYTLSRKLHQLNLSSGTVEFGECVINAGQDRSPSQSSVELILGNTNIRHEPGKLWAGSFARWTFSRK